MANEPYKDIMWLRQKYVTERRKLTDIQKILKEQYQIDVTPQTLYNWAKKFELLKSRGKGRNLKAGTKRMPKSPMQLRMEKIRRDQRKFKQAAKRTKRPR